MKRIVYLVFGLILFLVNCAPKSSNPTLGALVPLALQGESKTEASKGETITPEVVSMNENPSFPATFTTTGASFQTMDSSGKVITIETKPGGATTTTSGTVNANGEWTDLSGNVIIPPTGYNGASLYDNFTIIFGSPMNKASVEQNFVMKDSSGNVVPGAFIWSGDQHLQFDPYIELKEDTVYTIEISSGAKLADGITNANFSGYTVNYKTGSAFTMTHTIGGNQVNIGGLGEKGLFLNSDTVSTVPLSSALPHPERVQYVRLFKLGQASDKYYSVCDKRDSPDNVTNTCPDTVSIADLKVITPAELQPSEGGNTYYYCINLSGKPVDGSSGTECNYIRTFSFIYGKAAADPNAMMNNSLALTMNENSLNVVEKLVEKFATEQFQLEGKSLNGIINELTTRNFDSSLTVESKTCRSISGANGAYSNNFQYLSKIGPFCDEAITAETANLTKKNIHDIYNLSDGALKLALGALFVPVVGILYWYNDNDVVAYLTYDAKADVYIHEMKIPPTPSDVLKADLVPTATSLDVSLGTRKATGNMTMALEIQTASMAFLIKSLSIPLPDSLVQSKFMYTVPFEINPAPETTYRYATVKTGTSLNGSKVLITTNPPANFTPSDSVDFNFKQWNDNLKVGDIPTNPNHSVLNSSSSLAQLIFGFITPVMKVAVKNATLQKLPDIQPKVVGGVVKDTIEKAVPDLLNTIIDPFTRPDGYPIAMPTYLPEPFNTLKLKVKGIPALVKPGVDGAYKALEAQVNADIATEITKADQPKPAGFLGTDSYLEMSNSGLPTDGFGGTAQIKAANTINDGVLISLNPNAVNRTLYHLWKAGAFNLTLDKSAITLVKDFATQAGANTSVLELSESLLNAESILAVFAPNKVDWKVYDVATKTTRTLNMKDPVYIVTEGINPVVVSMTVPDDGTGKGIPELTLNINDLVLQIRGGSKDGSNYLISKIRTNMTIKSSFSIKKYTSAKEIKVSVNGKEIKYSSQYSLRVDVPIPSSETDVSKGVYYSLEVLKGQTDNPLGLNPTKMGDLIKPLVRTLVLPLINNLLGDIPLPPLKACGIEITDPNVAAIPTSGKKYIFLKAKMQEDSVPFTGNCSVKTILDLN